MCVLFSLLGLISMITVPISHFLLYLLFGFPFAFHQAVDERMLLFVTCHHQKISLLYIHFGSFVLAQTTTIHILLYCYSTASCPQPPHHSSSINNNTG